METIEELLVQAIINNDDVLIDKYIQILTSEKQDKKS